MYKKKEIVDWATARRIIQESNPITQADKTVQEANELLEAMQSGDIEDIKKEAGDIYVTLILACELAGIYLDDCIDAAYDKIKNRKGMMIQGFFVKESDIDQLHKMGFNMMRDRMRMTCDTVEQKDGAISILAAFNLKPNSKFHSESKTWEVWA